MKWLLHLYPAAWLRRYGEEFAAVLQGQSLSLGMVADVLAGAVDAWLHPQTHLVEHEMTKGEETMTNETTKQMILRCAAGGPKLSQHDQIVGSVTMVVGALVLAAAYIVLTWKFHSAPAVQALGYSAVPAMFQLYAHAAYLRRRPMSTQVVVTGSALGFIYLIMWGACEVAVRV